jgi:predicted aminopeptidase
MRPQKKRLLKWLVLPTIVILSLAFIFIHDLAYYYMQAKGQLAILWNVTPVEEVLKSPTLSENMRTKLALVQEIKSFGEKELGLTPTQNYTTFFHQHGRPILWVLSASKPFKLESYTWWFPIVGRVGYKGFFVEEKGRFEMQKLKEKGYDTELGEVSAWSTLGWFKDPVLSSMLQKSEGELARLILHEMTHSTLYIESDAVFNENLATLLWAILVPSAF